MAKIAIVGGKLSFLCPACQQPHELNIATWQWNQDTNQPTISPSINLKTSSITCHSRIDNGQIRYLNDSSHSLSGRTVELLEIHV